MIQYTEKYQIQTRETAIYPGQGFVPNDITALNYLSLGLCSESGEIASKVKKIIRDKQSKVTDKDLEDLKKEVGDVVWYCARLLDEMGFALEECMRENIEKLLDRKDRGVLQGSGDSR